MCCRLYFLIGNTNFFGHVKENLVNLVCLVFWRLKIWRKKKEDKISEFFNKIWECKLKQLTCQLSLFSIISHQTRKNSPKTTPDFSEVSMLPYWKQFQDLPWCSGILLHILLCFTWKFLANVRKFSYDHLTFSSIHIFGGGLMHRILNAIVCLWDISQFI